ncbi:hypothetical protein [Spirosoma montaniterrae]|uniref:Uncharacterized protein n=1 Tax=Spirosoma montaniterrae TaxID=1178516 RepID=A0A1P9WZ47_9BACT|nr:hypothetical protein [Spirosoma montaniterrae]AQG80598.1 hypothetical protein AWR27_15475 [Spirosoma montaniterrae]
MADIISDYQKMIDRLKKQGKVESIEPLLNSDKMRRVDQQMEEERKKFLRRDAESRQTANQILLGP